MKKISLGLTLLTSTLSYATCEIEVKTKDLINNLESNNVEIKQRFVRSDIEETKELIKEGEYCDDGFAALSLCTGLVTEHAYFGGLKAQDASKQYSLEKSLYEFAKMFHIPSSNSFGCNLIELDFPALD